MTATITGTLGLAAVGFWQEIVSLDRLNNPFAPPHNPPPGAWSSGLQVGQ